MYIINTIPHGKCFVRYLRTRCFCIRNLTRSLRSLVRFLIRQQLVRKYRTPALSMKYSLFAYQSFLSNTSRIAYQTSFRSARNDPSPPVKSQMRDPIGGRARNTFRVIHPSFFPFFLDGESSHAMHRRENRVLKTLYSLPSPQQ